MHPKRALRNGEVVIAGHSSIHALLWALPVCLKRPHCGDCLLRAAPGLLPAAEHLCACMCGCARLLANVCAHIHVVCVYTFVDNIYSHVCSFTCTHTHTHTHARTHRCTDAHTHTHKHLSIHDTLRTHTHTHVYTQKTPYLSIPCPHKHCAALHFRTASPLADILKNQRPGQNTT